MYINYHAILTLNVTVYFFFAHQLNLLSLLNRLSFAVVDAATLILSFLDFICCIWSLSCLDTIHLLPVERFTKKRLAITVIWGNGWFWLFLLVTNTHQEQVHVTV